MDSAQASHPGVGLLRGSSIDATHRYAAEDSPNSAAGIEVKVKSMVSDPSAPSSS